MLSLPVLPFDGDVAGRSVAGLELAALQPDQGLCGGAPLLPRHYRIPGESSALDASKASDDGVQGHALGITSFLKASLLDLFGPSFVAMSVVTAVRRAPREVLCCVCVFMFYHNGLSCYT